jgi:hypothetical protein
MKKLTLTVNLTSKEQTFKHNWHEFLCEIECPDGTIRTGVIQADSLDAHMIAWETLEMDEYHP